MRTLANTKKDYFEAFDSVADFRAGLERPRTGRFAEWFSSEKDSKDGWSGTVYFKEAEDLMNNGYDVGAKKLMDRVLKVHNEAPAHVPTYSVSGGAPVVARAIMGVPRAMVSMKVVAKPSPTRRVFIVNTTGHTADSEKLLDSGAVMLNICNQLEMSGVRTEIYSLPKFSYTYSRQHQYSCGCMVKIKGYRDPFNFKKMAYLIAHTSMFRRHGFKWLETCGATPAYKDRYTTTYGISFAREQEKTENKLKELGIAGDNDLVLTYGLVEKNEFKLESVMKAVGLKK